MKKNIVTEFAVAAEVVSATIDMPEITGERFSGPLHIGYYPNTAEDPEVWIEQEGRRIQFRQGVAKDVIKQLRRALVLAVKGGQQHGE